MKKKILWLVVSCLMALSLVLASCGPAEEEEEEVKVPEKKEEVKVPEEKEVVTPVKGNWWDYFGEPQYGGTFTFYRGGDVTVWDPYRGIDFQVHQCLFENLAHLDWTLDREIFSYRSPWMTPKYLVGELAESWETPDNNTIIFHIREGVHWHDKYPANGRELTAADCAFALNRQWGCGDGFTEISPFIYQSAYECYQKIYATDKYTMVVEHTDIHTAMEQILQCFHTGITCRDVVEEYGDLLDWKCALGTGPWMLDDYVAASSLTFIKNPNYWGYDERHPENKLPYVDGFKVLIIPDPTTAYAALRTGKIDIITGVQWEQADSLMKTNPELESLIDLGTCDGLRPRVDKEPFNDIRVRKAMNMAIDRQAIAESYYGGRVEGGGKVYPQLGPLLGEYYTPFEEWPKELQEEYTYNPEGAKQLLAEAGYPNGFKTNVVIGPGAADLTQIMQMYLADIGIDMEIKLMEPAVWFSYVYVFHKHDQMELGFGAAAWASEPHPWLGAFSTGHMLNSQMISDPVYDEMLKYARIDEQGNPLPDDEVVRRAKEMDRYIMKHHWTIQSPIRFSYILYQPWLKGYSGESWMRCAGQQYARWWIDHDVKEAMGY